MAGRSPRAGGTTASAAPPGRPPTAGSGSAAVRAGGGHELLAAQGPPLGLFPGHPYGSGALTLAPGDLVVLYTDGITEAANPDDEEFGLERLVALVRSVAARPLPGQAGP